MSYKYQLCTGGQLQVPFKTKFGSEKNLGKLNTQHIWQQIVYYMKAMFPPLYIMMDYLIVVCFLSKIKV